MGKIFKTIANILCGVLVVGAVVGAGAALYLGGKNNGWFDEYIKPDTEQIQPDSGKNDSPETAALPVPVSRSATKAAAVTEDNIGYDYLVSEVHYLSEGYALDRFGNFIGNTACDNFEYSLIVTPNRDNFEKVHTDETSFGVFLDAYSEESVPSQLIIQARNSYNRLNSGTTPSVLDLYGFVSWGAYNGSGLEYETRINLNFKDQWNQDILIDHFDEMGFVITKDTLCFTFRCDSYVGNETFSVGTREYDSFYELLISGELVAHFGNAYECIKLYNYRAVVPLPPTPTKEGHTFDGWYYDSAFTRPYDNEPIFEDTVLYAKFVINRYNVTFNSDGGSDVLNQTVDWGTTLTLETPTKTGYNFVGWYYSDGTKYKNQPIKSDTELTAHWEVLMYTVTFYLDNEVYETKQVAWGTVFLDIVELANTMNLQVMSLSSPMGETLIGDFNEMTVSGDLNVTATFMDGVNKVVNTAKNNKWAVIGGVAGGVALIAIIAAACSGTKRKKRK